MTLKKSNKPLKREKREERDSRLIYYIKKSDITKIKLTQTHTHTHKYMSIKTRQLFSLCKFNSTNRILKEEILLVSLKRFKNENSDLFLYIVFLLLKEGKIVTYLTSVWLRFVRFSGLTKKKPKQEVFSA